MGLFDCVGDNSKIRAKYPVSPPHHQAPMERGMSGRRSMGIFASNSSLKGNKYDINFWRHRLLCFLYKAEGREDVTSIRIPLKQFDYNSIGDFIRDIPEDVYAPYKAQLNPDTSLRKDCKVIWERDGIAEPGNLKWEGMIEGQRCMGLQLDRKKAVPFGLHDGKGLFYCKPGHRALVIADEVHAYKKFLRQFVGQPPKKDSMSLNLLPGRSSVRVAVAKQYKPGDRVHLPSEGKWATILWTGRIEGEWVVDLVYDPEKPRIASPDEPQMSRSLSMAEFIDEVGQGNEHKNDRRSQSQSSPTPPRHVPPPPPLSTRPPKSPDLEDEVFILQEKVEKRKDEGKLLPPTQPSHSDDSEAESLQSDDDSVTEESDPEESDHSASDVDEEPLHEPLVESASSDEASLHKILSEPGQDLSKLEKAVIRTKPTRYEHFDQEPLKSKPTHKPRFNLASLGRKKKTENPTPHETSSPKINKVQPIFSSKAPPAKKDFSFFSKNKKSLSHKHQPPILAIEPQQVIKRLDSTERKRGQLEDEPSFVRQDASRPEKGGRELPVDVPSNLRSPPSSVPDTPKTPLEIVQVEIAPEIKRPISSSENPKYSSGSEQESSDEDEGHKKQMNKDALVEEMPSSTEKAPSEDDSESDTTPPYSPAIKDVGFQMSPRTKKGSSKGSPFRSFGGIFAKSKPLPPKDYHVPYPNPAVPVRKESLEPKKDQKEETLLDSDSEDSKKYEAGRKLSGDKGALNMFRRRPKPSNSSIETSNVNPVPSPRGTENLRHDLSSTEQMGDQEFLTLDSLEVKEEQQGWSSPPPQSTSDAVSPSKRRGSKGKTSIFGFSSSKKQKSTSEEPARETYIQDAQSVMIVDDNPVHQPEPRVKPRTSFRESFNRTFSLTRSKSSSIEKRRGSGGGEPSRPMSLNYIDNNEAIGASNISRPKSKSASVLVDIQPWTERRGHRSNIHDIYDSPDESPANSPGSPVPVPALQPKQPDPTIPKHRIFTTPIGMFAFGQKSSSDPNKKPKKKTSFKGSKLPKPVKSPPPLQLTQSAPTKPAVLPKPAPPCHPPPAIPLEEASSPTARGLKSAMKQRKEIEGIPNGVKIGDRVIWYNGRIPVPGHVKKLYKDGTDKYTALVHFDRPMTSEPALSLAREGDGYIITVEELLTPEILGIVPISPPASVTTPLQDLQQPAATTLQNSSIDPDPLESASNEENEECKSPSVRFVPGPESPPEINVQLASPVFAEEEEDDRVPPPFQEEEVEVACGVRRGIPSRDRTCCIETILFAMFYATNTFDTSLLYGCSSFEDRHIRDIRVLLRAGIVHPLRQNGFCDWSVVKQLKDLLQLTSPEFNSMHNDADIMTLVLFERALKLGKFISYSNKMTDYLHQLVISPRDLCKSGTLQQLFESSLEIMDNCKLMTTPSPALIIEIPRANDKLVHYEAVIPNLTISLSHLLENGPRLCICGMVAEYECLKCMEQSGDKALVYCDNCTSTADQIHFQLGHSSSLVQIAQSTFSMDLVAVVCVKAGHYTAFVKCGSQRASPWLFYDSAEIDNPKVSLEQNLGMWIDRLEKYPGKYHEAFVHPLLTHFLSNCHICIYKPREKSSLV